MERLVSRAVLAAALLAAPAQSQMFCTPPRVLHQPDGAPIHLGRDAARLVHFDTPSGPRPRLLYKKRRPGGDGHELRVLEGGRQFEFGTAADVAATLPAHAFAGFTAPWIDAFEADGRWILLAVADGRRAVPVLARAPARVLLLELAPAGVLATVHVLASYWSDGRARPPRIADVRIDREPDPAAPGPLLSWTVTRDAIAPGADDDVWFCRLGPAGPLHAAQRAFAFAPAFCALTRHVATEGAGRLSAPSFLVSARAADAGSRNLGIFAAAAGRGAERRWLDAAGDEEILDRLGDRVFYLATSRHGGARLQAALTNAASSGRRGILWTHDTGAPGDDAALMLSRRPGFARAAWPDGPCEQIYGMFESHDGGRIDRPAGRAGGRFDRSEVLVFAADDRPVALRDLLPHSPELSVFAQAVSQNLCVVSSLPDPSGTQFRFDDFADADGDALAFWFHCAR